MKNLVACIILLFSLQFNGRLSKTVNDHTNINPAGNIFIITLDGFRWQEIFKGADPALINNEKYTPDAATMKMLYWSPDTEGRRKKLLPFFWNIIAVRGQLYGNRHYNNKVNVPIPIQYRIRVIMKFLPATQTSPFPPIERYPTPILLFLNT